MSKKLRIVLFILLALVFIVCSILIVIRLTTLYHDRATVAALRGMVSDKTPTHQSEYSRDELLHGGEDTDEESQTDELVVMDKYAQLYEENSDLIGWLYIEDSRIDYPVMYTPDEPDKYLHEDFYGEESVNGTLYLDARCDVMTSDNLIIYGHNMRSGDMFGKLSSFANENYWQEHKYITFDSIYDERQYEVVAAFYSRIMYTNEVGFRYYNFINAEDEDAFNEYVQYIDENQCYDTGVDISYGDKLLTLSTCAYQTDNGRFVVVARLVTE